MTEGASLVIAGRYRLISQLGQGGMGVVWHARDEVLNRDVALKEIRRPEADNLAELMTRRALREARAAARLRHPSIVTVHDVVTEDGRPWIVMELIRGRSLAQVIADDGALPERRVADIGRKVLGALEAAHRRGILHRDVKPANILLDGDRVVLTDFGIAAVDGATALTATGLLIGSPDYLAPERINGRTPTAAVDMWGVGVTLYAAVSGRPPFHREDTQTTLAAVLVSEPEPLVAAPEIWPVIRRLLAKDPAARLTATDAIPLLAEPPPAAPRKQRPPAGLIASSAVLLLLLGVGGWMNRNGRTEPSPQETATAPASPTPPAPSPSPVRTTPPPPAGFKQVGRSGYAIAVPNSWDSAILGWDNYTAGKAGPLISVEIAYSARNERMVADTVLIGTESSHPSFHHYKRLRLVRRLPTIEGAASVAEIESTMSLTKYPIWGYRRTIDRAFVTTAGTGVYFVTVEVAANTPSALRREWPKARATLLKILNSFRLAPS